jgi:hypothetical protein
MRMIANERRRAGTAKLPTCDVSVAALLAAALLAPLPALAEERGRSGFYVGGHVGYMFGTANATLGDPTDPALGLD